MKCCEKGRSMIEMLGVLAIVGVLSVGGIAGYTKAMDKVKVNKLMDQLSQTVIGIRSLYMTELSYRYLNKGILVDYGAIPSDTVERTGSDIKIYHTYGGELKIFISQNLPNDGAAFEIYVEGISEKACQYLVTTDWGQDPNSGFIGMYMGNDEPITAPKLLNVSQASDSNPEAGIFTSGQHEHSVPVDIFYAKRICHCPSSNCVLGFKYM